MFNETKPLCLISLVVILGVLVTEANKNLGLLGMNRVAAA
jgi:hypothetical protein